MSRFRIGSIGLVLLMTQFSALSELAAQPAADSSKVLRAGMIGLDTSHVIQFTNFINDPQAQGDLAKVKIVAGYPGGTDTPASRDRVKGFTQQIRSRGIEIVDTIPALLEKVDVVLLESVDGRIHLEEAAQVIKAGKPMFIDKPVAGSLADAIAIFELAKKHNVPVWSASSIRFGVGLKQALDARQYGEAIGCSSWGSCKYQDGIPDMFFYGVHGIEGLYTVMGTGCETVARVATPNADVLTGVWKDGRVGTFRGIRSGKEGYGLTIFGTKAIVTVDPGSEYQQTCAVIAKFSQTKQPPVSAEETIEIFTFMEAADESKLAGGVPVKLQDVLGRARKEAAAKLANLP